LTTPERLNILSEQIKTLFKQMSLTEIMLSDLPKIYFNQFHRKLDSLLYQQISIKALMEELSDCVIVDYCPKTKQPFIREITKENVENLATVRQELLLLLLQTSDFSDPESRIFVKYDILQATYETKYNVKLEMKNFSISSNINFRMIASRSMKDFIDQEQKEGFYLNRLFYEGYRLWDIILESLKAINKLQDRKARTLHMSYLEHEFERGFRNKNKFSLKNLLEKLSPILATRSDPNSTTVSLRSVRSHRNLAPINRHIGQ
jgi:hypothetical protein